MFQGASAACAQLPAAITPEYYIQVNNAIRTAMSGGTDFTPDKKLGRAAFLFLSPRYGRMAYEQHSAASNSSHVRHVASYFADVPRPFCLAELDERQLRRLIDLYGPDIMRANFIGANLIDTDDLPLITGGACALETWATRLLNKRSLQRNPSLRRKVLTYILDSAPYYTHVTGAMLLGAPRVASVLYDETFPWFMSIHDLGRTPDMSEDQWNPDVVKEITRELYDRIYAAVLRRSALISPQAKRPLRLPFDDLKLEEEGHLRTWYSQYIEELPPALARFRPSHYVPDGFMGAYVRYTYVGPNILDIVKRELAYVPGLNRHTVHVRTKQDDHLTEELRINQILLRGFHNVDPGFLNKYANLCKLAIYFWHQRNWDKGSNGFVGFTDFSFRGNIVHDTVDLNTGNNSEIKSEEQLWDVLTSPVRLNRRNIESHFQCLDKYLDSAVVHDAMANEVCKLKTDISKLEQKLRNTAWHAKERRLIRDVLMDLAKGPPSGVAMASIDCSTLDRLFGEAAPAKLLKQLRHIPHRYGRRAAVANHARSKPLLDHIFDTLSVELSNNTLLISLSRQGEGEDCGVLLGALITVLDDELAGYDVKEKEEQARLAKLKKAYANTAAGLSSNKPRVHETDVSSAKPSLLPLRDNLVFSHAIQLSFDANISTFILDAVKIETSALSTQEKKRSIVEACRRILPTIKAHLRFVMDDSVTLDVPRAPETNQRKVYQPVLLVSG
jgi:hypothetical protein